MANISMMGGFSKYNFQILQISHKPESFHFYEAVVECLIQQKTVSISSWNYTCTTNPIVEQTCSVLFVWQYHSLFLCCFTISLNQHWRFQKTKMWQNTSILQFLVGFLYYGGEKNNQLNWKTLYFPQTGIHTEIHT